MIRLLRGKELSWKVEVLADGESGWNSNLLRHHSYPRAQEYGGNLAMRWTLVKDWRIVASSDPVYDPGQTCPGCDAGDPTSVIALSECECSDEDKQPPGREQGVREGH